MSEAILECRNLKKYFDTPRAVSYTHLGPVVCKIFRR